MRDTWTVDSATLLSLRLEEAEKAFDAGDLDRALIEAEELLDEDPSHPKALALVGRSALRMGDIVMALEALSRFAELHTPDARVLHALAVARFQAVDYPGSLLAAEQASALDSSLTAAWHYQGLALQRLGNSEKADKCFQKAAELDPVQFPLHPGWADLDWASMLDLSISRLPQPIQVFIDGVEIRFADYPAIEDLLENYPPLSPFTDALYRGRPPKNEDPWSHRPQWITLFQGNLSRPTKDQDTIVQRIAEALMHEAMHWLGLSEMPA